MAGEPVFAFLAVVAAAFAFAGAVAVLAWRRGRSERLEREREAERARREVAQRLALFLRYANDAILLFDDGLRLVEANDRAAALYGYTPAELLGLTLSDLSAAEARKSISADTASIQLAGGAVYGTTHRRKDGRTVPVEVSSRPVEIGGRAYLYSIVRDVSERKAYERQLERLNRIYLALSRVSEAIVRTSDRQELLRQVCRILVEDGEVRVAWVGRPGPNRDVLPEAVWGEPLEVLRPISAGVSEGGEREGPTFTALREGRTCVVDDAGADPGLRGRLERTGHAWLRGCVALPLRSRGSVSGTLTVYSAEARAFGESEVSLLEKVAGEVSFALDVLARDEERRAAEAALRSREEIFSSIFAQALDAIALYDPATGRFVEFNEAAHRGLGYTREEFATLGLAGIQAEHGPEQIRLNVESIRQRGSAAFETRHRHKNGDVRAVHIRARQLTLQELPYIAVVWTDVTEARRADAERQALLDAMRAVVAARDVPSFLRLVEEALRKVVAFESLSVYLRDPKTGRLGETYPKAASPPKEGLSEKSLPAFVSRAEEALVVTPDVFARLTAAKEIDEPGLPASFLLGAPLRHGSSSLGALVVRSGEAPGRDAERDRRLLASVAAQVSLGVERHRSLETLAESAIRLQEAERIARFGVWDLDVVNDVLTWSDEIYRIFELEPQSFGATLQAFLEQVHPEDRQRVSEAYARSLTTREPYEVEHRLLLATGRTKVVRERCETWFDEAGRPLRSVGTVQDVTASKAVQEALVAANERMVEAQAIAGLGSWEQDLVGGALSCSAEVFRIVERDPASCGPSLEGFFQVVHPDEREAAERAYEESLSRGTALERDLRIVRRDGSAKWVRARWKVEHIADGRPMRAVGTLQDVTEHVLAREARTLAEAKEAAEAANRAKSAFLASMSHEIRTPMNSILGFSQLLLGESGLALRDRERVESIQRAGEHLRALIDDVLEMSKIEAGRVSVGRKETDLVALLSDLESMFAVRAAQKGVAFAVRRSPDLPRQVVTDERKLRQILINLIGNAVKFTAAGKIELRARADAVAGGGALLGFDVEDTGAGIAADEIPRLFQAFEQTRTGREASVGTGLGLAISRGFARLLGGDISVRSRPGEGAVFTLSLPVAVSATFEGGRAQARRVVGLAPGEERRRVLVVDDVADNREILRQMLGRVGLEVRTADDARRALELHASWNPHLVLMDLRMPGVDGLEAIRTIRARETAGRVPIIAITASAFEHDRTQAREAGSDDFVSKPFREADLLESVGRLLGVRWILDEAAVAPVEERAPRPSDLGALDLPGPIRDQLRRAVVAADLDGVARVADDLARLDPAAARTVRDLVERYEYDRLLALLGNGD